VHGFFAFRIYALTKQVYIPSILWLIATLLLLSGIGVFAASLRATSLGTFVIQWEWLFITVCGLGAATSLGNTTTLVAFLHIQRPQAHKRTAAVLAKLILWTIG
ncbi:hypothetical protein K438DRAFT_1671139, partial [Mycena galopus ATCC 62051]